MAAEWFAQQPAGLELPGSAATVATRNPEAFPPQGQ